MVMQIKLVVVVDPWEKMREDEKDYLADNCNKNGSLTKMNLTLRSRCLEVVGSRKNGRACIPLGRPFFLAPTTSKRLLHRLWGNPKRPLYRE